MAKAEIDADILKIARRLIGHRLDHARGTLDSWWRCGNTLCRSGENRARFQRFLIRQSRVLAIFA